MGSPGSFDLSPVPLGMAVNSMPIAVALYVPGSGDDEDEGGNSPYTILPNVYCLRIDCREGAEPPVARFTYLMDDQLQAAMNWPSQFEKVWPIDAQGNYVVNNDDRLCVISQIPPSTPDGKPKTIVLFDGFAQIPQIDVSAQQQSVTFVAVNVATRLWDLPIFGRTQRAADDTEETSGAADYFVEEPCRFNPSDTTVGALGGYIGNCTATDFPTEDPDDDSAPGYPVFLDPLVVERGEDKTSFWYVADAMSYLIGAIDNPKDSGGNPYVVFPTLGSLQTVLACQAPPMDGVLNSADAVQSNIQVRDYDASNKAVPDAMAELLRYCGFVMHFYTHADSDGNPETKLKGTRRDALSTTTPKVLYLDSNGASSLNLSSNNVTALHLARDSNQVVNQWRMETSSKQVEISVYLAPAFEPSSGDSSDRKPFLKSNLTDATSDQRRMYRWFIADECGDGFYDMDHAFWVADAALDLTPVFPDDDSGDQTYVTRYRPGSNTLIAKDEEGRPLKVVLEVATGSWSGPPAIENGSQYPGADWVTVTDNWRLLPDRLGIAFTGEDPGKWTTGAQQTTGATASVAHINILDWLANPTGTGTVKFVLRLTTVIEADQQLTAYAAKRTASPTQFAKERTADGRDHFKYCTISKGSLNYSSQFDINGDPSDGTNPLVMRDDSKPATTHAQQLRSAHEFPTLAGSATLPFITDYYHIGDRVKVIQGRNASMQVNVGVDKGEAPRYPWITAFAWDFSGDKQQTILQFSDRRAEPQGV